MKHPFGVQLLPSSITLLGELALAIYCGVQAVVATCDMRWDTPAAGMLPPPVRQCVAHV